MEHEPDIEPIDVEMEIPTHVWDAFIVDIERWNRQQFPGAGVWVQLTEEEVIEAMAYFSLKPFVRRVLCEGRPGVTMSFHVRPAVLEQQSLAVALAKPERWAVTVARAGGVDFALYDGVPGPLRRLARASLERVRLEAKRQEDVMNGSPIRIRRSSDSL